MKATKLVASLLLLCFFSQISFAQRKVSLQATSDSAIEAKVNALLAKMTLAEKLGQLQQLDGDWGTGEARR